MTTAATVAGRTERGRTAPGRRLGAADAAALIVSNVVGIGIFTTPGIVAGLVGGPLPYLGVWLAGAVEEFSRRDRRFGGLSAAAAS